MAEKLEIVIGATDKYSRAFKGLEGSLARIRKAGLVAGAAVAGMATGLTALVNSTAKAGDELQKMSIRTGIATDTLAGLSHAAEIGGADINSIERGLKSLSARMNDATDGLAEAQRAFDKLGVSVTQSDGSLRDMDDILPELADRFAGMESATQKLALAQELFGRAGMQLVPMLDEGAEGLRRMKEEADRLGISFSQVEANQAAAFRDAMTRLQGAIEGVRNTIGKVFIPTFTAFAENLSQFIATNREQISDWSKQALEAIKKFMIGTADLVDSLFIPALKYMYDQLVRLWDVYRSLPGWVQAVGLGGALIGGKRGAIVVGGLVHLYDAFKNSAQGIAEAFKGNIKWSELATMNYGELRNKLQELKDRGIIPVETELQKLNDFDPSPVAGKFREFVESLFKETDLEAKALPPFTDMNLAKTKDNAQKAIETLQEKQEALTDMWFEYIATDLERLDRWYVEQQERFMGHEEAMATLREIYEKRKHDITVRWKKKTANEEKNIDNKRVSVEQQTYNKLEALGRVFGEKGVMLARAIAIPRTIMATHEAAIQAYKALAGIPIIGPALGAAAAAAAYAYGMVQVAGVRGTSFGMAHGGLEYVPREQTYLLDRGERVLSPSQNKDFTHFMRDYQRRGIAETGDVNINFHVSNVEALLDMDKRDWQDIVEEKIVPALRTHKRAGISHELEV